MNQESLAPIMSIESKQYGDTVVVIVNGDTFLKNKKVNLSLIGQ
jgi:hypothetical protein